MNCLLDAGAPRACHKNIVLDQVWLCDAEVFRCVAYGQNPIDYRISRTRFATLPATVSSLAVS